MKGSDQSFLLNLDESPHSVALDPGLPPVELTGAFGALQVDLATGDSWKATVGALAVDRDVKEKAVQYGTSEPQLPSVR